MLCSKSVFDSCPNARFIHVYYMQVQESASLELQTELKQLQSGNSDLQHKLQKLYEAYRSLRQQFEDAVPSGESIGTALLHEDKVIGGPDNLLHSARKSSSTVKGMSVKPQKIQSQMALPQGLLQFPEEKRKVHEQDVLKFENERLRSELDRLRPDFTQTPLHQIRAENCELRAQVPSMLQYNCLVVISIISSMYGFQLELARLDTNNLIMKGIWHAAYIVLAFPWKCSQFPRQAMRESLENFSDKLVPYSDHFIKM